MCYLRLTFLFLKIYYLIQFLIVSSPLGLFKAAPAKLSLFVLFCCFSHLGKLIFQTSSVDSSHLCATARMYPRSEYFLVLL